MFAQIDQATGRICATTSLYVTSSMPEGIVQIEVPSEIGEVAGTHQYNFLTHQFEPLIMESVEGDD